LRQVVLEAPRQVRVLPAEPARPREGEALVRLRLGGICGSDLAAYRGVSPMVSYPRVLGHELLVDVLECPGRPELTGRRAVVEPLLPCGRCRPCRRGRYNCCMDLRVLGVHVDGGLRQTAVFDARQLHPVPDGIPDEVAVLAEPLAVAYHAVQRAGMEAGQVAVVLGAGTIGLLVARLLVGARGCRVFSVDVDPWRLSVAERLGAVPLPADAPAVRRAVAEATDGEMADAVFEASGAAACTRLTTDLVAHGGRIVLIGWNKGPVEVDTVQLMRREADLLGSRNSADAFPAVLRLLQAGLLDPGLFVTHRYRLDEAGEALELLDGGREPALKVLLAG
jgi:L-gulonate 5-dehydrogenase